MNDRPSSTVSRRTILKTFGGVTAGAVLAGTNLALAAPAAAGATSAPTAGRRPSVRIGDQPAALGHYVFPADVPSLILDNGLVRITFGRDDEGVVTGWGDVSITATSVIVAGRELAHNLNGVNPRDPDRQHSFYVDAGGGRTRLVCSGVDVLRIEQQLVEVAFVDTTSTPLRHEHHLIMRAGRQGIYGYDIMTAITDTTINEVRMNTRWDRSILDHAYNWERPAGQQPTYAYLATQQSVQDETWRVDGINNPALPSPDSNSGNLSPGSVYSKYEWSLYYHENPMFGHFGNGFGAWFTPLGGVTDDTLCAFYGAGPQHQDLAIHQDALILNYFSRNHYGQPAYPIPGGYRRLYGPWLTFFTVGDPNAPDAMIEDAARTARQQIAEHRHGANWVRDDLYPAPPDRTTVTGRVRLRDGRPAANFHVILSTQTSPDVYPIAEPTFFVKTDGQGRFRLPGIPPAWLPGTTQPGTYTLYIEPADGSVTDMYTRTGLDIKGACADLGDIEWNPGSHGTFIWQLGRSDRRGGEFGLAALSPVRPMPREYEKPAMIPGDLTFTIGESWEPSDWYYAQTNPGSWTIKFALDRAFPGTAYLTVATSMQQTNTVLGGPPGPGVPTVAVNGNTAAITGSLPTNNDSTIARQADRSGYPRTVVLTFPAGLLSVGDNTITFTHGPGSPAGTGLGWDTLLLEIDEGVPSKSARLRVATDQTGDRSWIVTVRNDGAGTAHDVRIRSVSPRGFKPIQFTTRDPNSFPIPIAAVLPPGGSATAEITVKSGKPALATVSADGGRTIAAARFK